MWRSTITRSRRPLARAVRTKSACTTSSMPPRVRRAMYAAYAVPSVSPGRITWRKPPQPAGGNQYSVSENTRTSSGPSTNVGTLMPIIATAIAA